MRLDADEVLRLIQGGEGSRLEFKAGLPRGPKVARTLAAFANTRGGHLLVGVGDKGDVLGAPAPRRTAAELRAIAAELVDPPLAIDVRAVRVRGLPVVVATVGLSAARPHAVLRESGERELPVRVGSSTRSARGPALEALRLGARARGAAGLNALERDVLAWVERQGVAGSDAGRATAAAFARERNVGAVRARRVFVKLERAGYLAGFGGGARRSYART